jgi:hypothetical protein
MPPKRRKSLTLAQEEIQKTSEGREIKRRRKSLSVGAKPANKAQTEQLRALKELLAEGCDFL